MLSRERKARLCLMPSCKGKRFDLVHKFPMDNERAEQWRTILDMRELCDLPIETIRKRFFICSMHFRKEDYKNCESRNLNKTAYPRLFLSDDSAPGAESMDEPIANVEEPIADVGEPQPTMKTEPQTASTPPKSPIGTGFLQKVYPKISPAKAKVRVTGTTLIPLARSLNPKDSLPKSVRRIELPCYIGRNKVIVTASAPSGVRRIVRAPQIAVLDVPPKSSAKPETNHDEAMIIEAVQPSEEKSSQTRAELKLRESELDLHHPSLVDAITLNYFWLRDHCRCAYCFVKNHRIINILDIPLEIKPILCKVTNEQLHIKWLDKHESTYEIASLVQAIVRPDNGDSKVLWQGNNIDSQGYARVSLSDYLSSVDVSKTVVHSLCKFGVAFIENVPCDLLSTELAIRRLFPVQKSRIESETAADSHNVAPHSAQTYLNDAAGLRAFHCIEKTDIEGDVLLVDGFNALNGVHTKSPKSYHRLCTSEMCNEETIKGVSFSHCAPIVRIDSVTNQPKQIRFNLSNRTTMTRLSQNGMLQFYRALRELTTEVQRSESEWWIKLAPGTVCIVDNWRILCGRSINDGHRKIVECFVSRDHFMGVVRKFNLSV